VAELDYAFLAEFARVDPGGKLTAVGASYTIVQTPALPITHLAVVAGRVRSTTAEVVVPLRIEWTLPGGQATLGFDTSLVADAPVVYDGNKIGLMFAFTTVIPISVAGLCTVRLYLSGVLVRTLAFEVVVSQPQT
jgi:hypothetical protein